MRIYKQPICLLIAAILSLGTATLSFASDTKIDKVTLSFSYDKAPKSGEEIGSVNVKSGSSEYSIDSAEYTNDTETWSVGDRPTVLVQLSAQDGYRFSYTSKSHFSLSGASAAFKKAKIYDDGASMEVEVYLKRVGGKLTDVDNLEWRGTTATWDPLEGAKSYEVRLYRDERSVTTVTTTDTSYNFAGNMNRQGDYNFRIRAIASYDGRSGEWSDYSDDNYVDEEDIKNYSGTGRWVQDSKGIWYAYDSGGYPAGGWKQIDNQWFYFNGDGYIQTGWIKLDGLWYFLNPHMLTGWNYINERWYLLTDAGVMLTGWNQVDGKWYYMDSSGALTHGWQYVNGKWYYMDSAGVMLTGWNLINGKMYFLDSSGAMYANTTTPDGHYVDGSGALVY